MNNYPHHHSPIVIESGHSHFVVTEDLYPLMLDWAERKQLVIPGAKWFARNHQLLHTALGQILNKGDDVVVVDSLPYYYIGNHLKEEIYRHFIGKQTESGSVISFESIISLDKVYLPRTTCKVFPLEITRGVDVHGRDVGRRVRPHSQSIEKQIQEFKQSLSGFDFNVVLVDDGIWTGQTIELAINALREFKFTVFGVVVGLCVKKKGHVIDFKLPLGSKIAAVETYESDSRPALDWVCERDFFPGVPFGGRTVFDDKLQGKFLPTDEKTIGAYYIENQEWLRNWASISDPTGEFRNFCVTRSIALFEEIGRLSGREVVLRDLDRIPLSLAREDLNMTNAVVKAVLKEMIIQ